ncbi:MAG: carbon-nitrogen hydrolase family protein [Acidobacteria bacterium]|nr:carbon-nitrogen hydrolase family protein [Acidobacteriota bacterium]
MSKPVRVAVIEADPTLEPGTGAWDGLAKRTAESGADLLVLNELPFGPWIATLQEFEQIRWERAVAAHARAVAALGTLGSPAIVGSRPVEVAGIRCNEAFLWTSGGLVTLNTKQHIPWSPGYWERTWYEPGPRGFPIVEVAGLRVGVLLCSDVMFTEHARDFGRRGAHLVAVPRAMPPIASHFFRTALTMAAIAGGCFVASSNRAGADELGQKFEGRGCVIDPLGATLAETTTNEPLMVADIDPQAATDKQRWYPCDLPE